MIKKTQIAVIVIIILVLGFIAVSELAWNGKVEAQTDFKEFTPYFSVLKPQERVSQFNYIKASPVYFDLSLPRDFDSARIEVEYKDDLNYPIEIGPNIKEGWDMKKLANDLPESANGYKISSVDFDLAGKNINFGKLRFEISIPGIPDESHGVEIKSLKVTLTRQSLYRGIWQSLSAYFNYVKSQH